MLKSNIRPFTHEATEEKKQATFIMQKLASTQVYPITKSIMIICRILNELIKKKKKVSVPCPLSLMSSSL